jgi:hypothetical protein
MPVTFGPHNRRHRRHKALMLNLLAAVASVKHVRYYHRPFQNLFEGDRL